MGGGCGNFVVLFGSTLSWERKSYDGRGGGQTNERWDKGPAAPGVVLAGANGE